MAATKPIRDASKSDGPRLLLLKQGMVVASYAIGARETTIGRSTECAVCLDDPRASRIHAKLTLRDGDAVIEDLASKNPTRVNEQPISEWGLRSGDVIRVGRSVLIYLAGGAGGRAPKQTYGSVIARQDGGGAIKVPLTEQPFLIGRIEQANIQLQGDLIRDCHAMILTHPCSADLMLLTAQPPRIIPLANDAEIGCGTVTLFCRLKPLEEEPQQAPDEQPLIVYPVAEQAPASPPKPLIAHSASPSLKGPSKAPAILRPASELGWMQLKPPEPPPPPKPRAAPSFHLDLHCGTVTLMRLLRKDVQRQTADEEDPFIADALLPDERAASQPEMKGGVKLTVVKGRASGQTFPVVAGRCLIGSDTRCGIRLMEEGVAPRHAAILTRVGRVLVEDLGSQRATFVNGRKIRTQPLNSGDTIRVGDCELLVHL